MAVLIVNAAVLAVDGEFTVFLLGEPASVAARLRLGVLWVERTLPPTSSPQSLRCGKARTSGIETSPKLSEEAAAPLPRVEVPGGGRRAAPSLGSKGS